MEWLEGELETLAQAPLFRGFSRAGLLQAVEDTRCSREKFPKGVEIYNPFCFRRSLGCLLSGSARVTKGALVVSDLSPGELFGAAALFNGRENYETTISARTCCVAAFFPEKLVAELVNSSPTVCRNYLEYLSDRIHFLSRKIEGLSSPGAAEKLRRYLLTEGGVVTCPVTELAHRLDVSRASLYRAFEELERSARIRREGKTVTALDGTEYEESWREETP